MRPGSLAPLRGGALPGVPPRSLETRQPLELNPSEVQALCWYAFFLATAGRWEEAIAKSMKAIEVNPLSAYTNAVEGTMYTLYGGATPKAIEAFKRALEIDPDHSVALCYSGLAYGRAGEHDRAIEALTRVSELTGRATLYLGMPSLGFRKCGARGRGAVTPRGAPRTVQERIRRSCDVRLHSQRASGK